MFQNVAISAATLVQLYMFNCSEIQRRAKSIGSLKYFNIYFIQNHTFFQNIIPCQYLFDFDELFFQQRQN